MGLVKSPTSYFRAFQPKKLGCLWVEGWSKGYKYKYIYISVLHTSLTAGCLVLKALASLTFLSRFSCCLLVLLSSRVLPHQRRGERNGHLHFGLLAWKYHDVRLLGVSLHLILIFRKCLPVKRTLGITHYRGGGVWGQRIALFGEVTGQYWYVFNPGLCNFFLLKVVPLFENRVHDLTINVFLNNSWNLCIFKKQWGRLSRKKPHLTL